MIFYTHIRARAHYSFTFCFQTTFPNAATILHECLEAVALLRSSVRRPKPVCGVSVTLQGRLEEYISIGLEPEGFFPFTLTLAITTALLHPTDWSLGDTHNPLPYTLQAVACTLASD